MLLFMILDFLYDFSFSSSHWRTKDIQQKTYENNNGMKGLQLKQYIVVEQYN